MTAAQPAPCPKAAGGKPAQALRAACQSCNRGDGLPLLLVSTGISLTIYQQALTAHGYAYASEFDADFGKLQRKATLPVIRLLPTGFVYVFYEKRGVWDLWQSYSDGTYQKLLEQVTPDEYAKQQAALKIESAESVCQRGAANLAAGLITLIGASTQPAIWLAYAPHKWTPQVLQDFHSDRHGKRRATMTLVPAKSWLDGGANKPGPGLLALEEAQTLQRNIIDFTPSPARPGTEHLHPLIKAFAQVAQPLRTARFGQAAALVEKVRAMEKTAGAKAQGKALIVCLRNDIGIAEDYAALLANTQAAYTEWTALGPRQHEKHDPHWAWKHQSALHVRYVQEWSKAVAKNNVLHDAHQRLNGAHEHLVSRNIFERDLAQGLLPADSKWVPEPLAKNAQGPTSSPGLGRIVYSEQHVQKAAQAMGIDKEIGRSERYLGKVDIAELEAFEKSHRGKNQDWQEKLIALETDRVSWLESQPFATCMRYQFDEHQALCGKSRSALEIRLQLQEALDRLAATERAYGMPALTPIMLRHIAQLMQKDEKDPSHWLAKALISEFDLMEQVTGDAPDHGLRADLYDAITAKKEGWAQFATGWAMLREPAAHLSAGLLNAAQQATGVLLVAALDAEKAKNWGLAIALKEASRKQIVWLRATALQEFLTTGNKHFFVDVKWKIGALLDASTEALKSPMFELKFNHRSARQRQSWKSASASTQAELRKLHNLPGMDKEVTVPLLVDVETLKKAAAGRKTSMLRVVSPNLVGLPQPMRELPEEFARNTLKQQAIFRKDWAVRFSDNLGKNKLPAGASAAVIFLQGYALKAAIEDFRKKGGAEQIDAAAAIVSSALGIAGAVVEVAYLLSLPASTATPQAASLASKVPRHITLRFAGGVLAGAGMILDMVSAGAKAITNYDKGNHGAAVAHGTSAALHFVGGSSTIYGAYLSWRSAQLVRLGVQGVVRVSLAPLMTALGLGGLGLALTGIGLLLWLGGVAIGIIATILEDDECEEFLKRSYFGKGGNTALAKFPDLEKETLALGALARGIKVELEWNDNILSHDMVKAHISCMEWDAAKHGLTVTAEGYDAVNGQRIELLADVDVVIPEKAQSADMYQVNLDYAITNPAIQAVKLSFAFLDISRAGSKLPGQTWRKARAAQPLAQDFLWIKD